MTTGRRTKSVLVSLHILLCLFGILAVLSVPLAHASFDPWASGWQYRKQMTVDHTKVSATLMNFPLLVDLTDSDLASKAQSDGGDILFMDGIGSANKLDHEIESYTSATGHLVAWLRIPSLSSAADTAFYLYYGNPSASDQQNGEGVWDPRFVMVQHLSETSGTHYDSTSHHNDGTPTGGVSQGVAGRIDGADNFDGVDDRIDVAHSSSLNFGTGDFTISAWIKYTNCIDTDITRKGNMNTAPQANYKMEVTSNRISGTLQGSKPGGGGSISTSTTYNDDSWHYAVFMRNAGTISLYVDGGLKASQGGAGMDLTNTANMAIGAKAPPPYEDFFTGMIDEARYANAALGADWILTSYRSATEQFISYGVEQQNGATTYDVSFYSNPTSGGIIADGVSEPHGSTGTYNAGQRVHVIANAPTGYAFSLWEVSGVSVDSTTSADTYMTVTDDGGLTAQFTQTDPEYDFTFVWMSDTQHYSESYPSIYDAMTQWIADNEVGMDIRYAIHTGDIVQVAETVSQWVNADDSMDILDGAGVPYGILAGNHDVTDGAANYHAYFGSARFQPYSYYHNDPSGNNDNHYDLITADGLNFVIVYLSYGTTASERAWASSIFQAYQDRIGILALHDYLAIGGGYSGDGSAIYNDVVASNSNVWLVACGHNHSAHLNVKTVGSRTIYELLSDYQALPNGGNGYQKIFYFDIAHSNVHVNTYSTELDQYGGTGYNYDEFDMTLPQQFPIPPTITVAGAYHGARLEWNDVGALGYNIYYSTNPDVNSATQYVTGVTDTTLDVLDLPQDTWDGMCYFWVAPVGSGGEAPPASWGSSSDNVWSYKIEITSVTVVKQISGDLKVNVEYRSRYLGSEGIAVGVQIGEYLGPGTPTDVPNRLISLVSTRPIALPSFMSTGTFNFESTSGEFVSGSSYKAWIMLWNQLPSEPGYWEAYSAKYELIPITIS